MPHREQYRQVEMKVSAVVGKFNLQALCKSLFLLGIFLCVSQVIIAFTFNNSEFRSLSETLRNIRDIRRLMTITTQNDVDRDRQHSEVVRMISGGNQTSVKAIQGKALHIYDGHDGFFRARQVRDLCSKIPQMSYRHGVSLLGSVEKRLLYCPIEKVGTTFWRRFMYMVANRSTKYTQPYDVPIETALGNSKLYTLPSSRTGQGAFLTNNSFSFYFVRDPYSRLLSAFVDKLLAPNPIYWRIWGTTAMRNFRKNRPAAPFGHDVTFPEFVKYVIKTEKTGTHVDEHFHSGFKMCQPCGKKYNYIGKMETFQNDALFILNRFEFAKGAQTLETRIYNLSRDDAITDSIYSPFSWKRDILKSLTWEKALKRIWLKLQLRGIIAFNQTFPLSNDQIKNISDIQFVNVVRAAHAQSDPEELKKQKIMVLKEAYSLVREEDLKEFKKLFQYDFSLYGYNPDPDFLKGENYTSKRYFEY